MRQLRVRGELAAEVLRRARFLVRCPVEARAKTATIVENGGEPVGLRPLYAAETISRLVRRSYGRKITADRVREIVREERPEWSVLRGEDPDAGPEARAELREIPVAPTPRRGRPRKAGGVSA